MVKEKNRKNKILFNISSLLVIIILLSISIFAEEIKESNEDILMRINLPNSYLEKNYPEYSIEDITRSNIIFGEPVQWKILLSNEKETLTLFHETPAINIKIESFFDNKFWIKNVTLSTVYPEIYKNLELSIEIPLMDNLNVNSEIGYSQDSLDRINFVLPKLNQTQTIKLKGLRKDTLADDKYKIKSTMQRSFF